MSTATEKSLAREVGWRIAQLRADRGMKQEELAGRLAVTRSCVSHWERGSCPPSLWQVIQLCQVFQVRPGELIPEPALDTPGAPGFSPDQLDRMARYVQSLSEIVTAARKQGRGTKEPRPATRKSDAGPRANSGRG